MKIEFNRFDWIDEWLKGLEQGCLSEGGREVLDEMERLLKKEIIELRTRALKNDGTKQIDEELSTILRRGFGPVVCPKYEGSRAVRLLRIAKVRQKNYMSATVKYPQEFQNILNILKVGRFRTKGGGTALRPRPTDGPIPSLRRPVAEVIARRWVRRPRPNA